MSVLDFIMWYLIVWVATGLGGLLFSMILELCIRAVVRGFYEQRYDSSRNNYLKGAKDGEQAGP